MNHTAKIFQDKLSLDGMCAPKRRVNKIIREIKLERQGAIKPVKRLESQRVLRAAILKVGNFMNSPDPWPLRAISRKLDVPLTTTVEPLKSIRSRDLISTVLCHSIPFERPNEQGGATVEIESRDRGDMREPTVSGGLSSRIWKGKSVEVEVLNLKKSETRKNELVTPSFCF